MYPVNILATKALAEMAHKMNVKFIFSSIAIVHDSKNKNINISSPINTDTDYTKSKYDAELSFGILKGALAVGRKKK